VSIDAEGNVVGAGDVCRQLRQAYLNVQEVLAEFGASGDNIVDETWFVTDIPDVMANVESLMAIRQEVLGSTTRDVTHTLVQVAWLVVPELQIEVKCIAHL
jgi:enamine deaminase RidA (YjgF/YER057c/UK114 family)